MENKLSKFLPTLKWEGIAAFMRLRWLIFPVAIALCVLLVLPVFGVSGDSVLWFVYFAVAFAGLFLCFFNAFNIHEIMQNYQVTSRLISRSFVVVLIARIFYNALLVIMGFTVLYLSSAARLALEIEGFDILFFIRDMYYLEIYTTDVVVYFVLCSLVFPALSTFWNSVGDSYYTKGVALSQLGYMASISAFVAFAMLVSNVILLTVVLSVVPVVLILVGCWIYDNKADVKL
jgi:hypothetical protein